ncbi:uncharacterized protein LOC123301208 [Chrysoperla carnea]|uniref:uncharacterized protein LOC123301208 n=1 Tax=Chrysoperla carnea TaxID=189513 RepID=UPI001D062641|nr:uncharacterized protein LOC123301208 [Chrysoperla carnea]
MSKKSNDPEFIKAFIELYKLNPCLWQIKHSCYTNKVVKQDAYAKLVKLYRAVEPNATIDTVKQKINNLRSSFRKELRKVRKNKPGAIYNPSLWYFNLLLFTADQEEFNKQDSNSNDDDTTVDETEDIEEMCNDLPIPIFCSTGAFSPSPSYFSTSFERPISRGSDTASIDSKNRIKNELSSQYESYENLLINSKTLDDNDSNIGVDSLKKRKIAREIEGKDEFHYIGINIAYKLRQMNEVQRIQTPIVTRF